MSRSPGRRKSSRACRLEILESRQLMSANQSPDVQLDHSELAVEQMQVGTQATDANAMSGTDAVRANYGFTGRGQTVAVIDTGIAYDHAALGGGFGAGYRVVGGYDFAEQDANPYDDGSAGSHGTHVAGIIGSTSAIADGVAPGVDLVALRVFDDAGNGQFAWVEQALRWVHQHRNDFANPITAVNLSIGTSYNGSTIPNWAILEDEFTQLEADGIFIAVAAGNSFSYYNTPGLSYPAVSSHVVPVASVDADGQLSSFSQRNSRVIAAPGRSITSTVPDYVGNLNGRTDDFATFSGTSMASPYIAGASTIIRQALQFAGQSNVTEWTIYNIMKSTADSVYDSVTNASYSRLNLQRAIDSIMPADEFGSTANNAFALTANGARVSVNGAIARLDDKDFFTFTAAESGSVTFKVTAGQELIPQFTTTGLSAALSADGKSITFNVVAGQTYTFGVGTSGGLGRYTLEGDIRTSMEGWGVVDFKAMNDLQVVDGERWISVTAKRSGTFTVESLFAHSGGNVDLELYTSSKQLLASCATNNNSERIDLDVTAGQIILVRLVGSNNDVDVRVTNMVQQNGATVTVFGTDQGDTFSLTAGANRQISINGTQYQFANEAVNKVVFNGGTGVDTATYNLTAGNDVITACLGNAAVTFDGFQATASGIENMVFNGNGGADVAHLYDGAGNDTLVSTNRRSVISGTGFRYEANNFGTVNAHAIYGGIDSAYFYGSAGNDVFVGRTTSSAMSGIGFSYTANSFNNMYVYGCGGSDVSYLYDSAGNDLLSMYPTIVGMQGAGYMYQVNNFTANYAYRSTGNDVVTMIDSAGNDTFLLRPDYAMMAGTGFNNFAVNFRVVVGVSTGGYDTAVLVDSTGNDTLKAKKGFVSLVNNFVSGSMYGFKKVTAYGQSGGRNKAQIAALDFVFEKVGKW